MVPALALSGHMLATAAISFAADICRRLLMHALLSASDLAFMKDGSAITARRPMIATTIMISTSVNPDRFLRMPDILYPANIS
jgi:hypothetical protein